ncbi:MAG: methionyl-tRNA formyltransferase [Deltaproteobacteria bacterium]|nr:methionyl-tRNA formyltransferase [Deltaproteobacteria bacterium]
MGTPDFAVPALRALIETEVILLAVVTQPDRPKGRGRKLAPPPVKQVALEEGLQVLQPERASSPEFCEEIRKMSPDLIVVVAFGQILKKNLLEVPTWGALNIHASLLPKYRGAAPIQWVILQGETKTGLTAMKMDEGMDTGPVIRQMEIAIERYETGGHLHDRLSSLAGPFLVDVLDSLTTGDYSLQVQDDFLATYAPKITRDMAKIVWERSAGEISCKIRAFDPWPGAFSFVNGNQVKFFGISSVEEGVAEAEPGTVLGFDSAGMLVQARDGVLTVGEMQFPGKRRMAVAEIIKGFSLRPGDKFQS